MVYLRHGADWNIIPPSNAIARPDPAMIETLEHHYYHDPDLFNRECDQLFRRHSRRNIRLQWIA